MPFFEQMYHDLSDAVTDSIHILVCRQDISRALDRLTAAQRRCDELYLQALEAELHKKNR